MSANDIRAAQNESLFRDFNERIRTAVGASGRQPLMIVCECGQPGCDASIKVEAARYEAVRAHGDRFVVKPGHESPAVERVIEKTRAYWVVQKTGLAGDVAEELDPRP